MENKLGLIIKVFVLIMVVSIFTSIAGFGLRFFLFPSIGTIISTLIGFWFIQKGVRHFSRGGFIGGGIMAYIGLRIALSSLIRFFPILGSGFQLLGLLFFGFIALLIFFPKFRENKHFSKLFGSKDNGRYAQGFSKDYNSDSDYRYDNYSNKKSAKGNRSQNSAQSSKARAFFEGDPTDPFSYRKRSNTKDFKDVEYEDWDESEDQKKNFSDDENLEYSYSKQGFKRDSKTAGDFDTDTRSGINSVEHNVSFGSIKVHITEADLSADINEVNVSCSFGDAKIIIDEMIPTEIKASVSVGEIRIGKDKYEGVNRKVFKRWVPSNPIDKVLYVNCRVKMGEVKIIHR